MFPAEQGDLELLTREWRECLGGLPELAGDADADRTPGVVGLPDDRCQCAHWGYIISGTMRVYGADGSRDYSAGETYYWAPGHNLEAVTDAEYLEITRSEEYDHLMKHCRAVMAGEPAPR